MISEKSVLDQLKKLGFNPHGWGHGEVSELHNILLPDEEIYDLVNGIYEGGFALLLSTDVRVLLIDKKPLNFLTVEDMRFDQINELDYSHRLLGAYISISSGSKNLKFRSYNQQRLRKLMHHVQHCMAEVKKQQSNGQQDQRVHLEQINQQLQAYLIAQHHQQEQLRLQFQNQANSQQEAQAIKPPPELADFLYAQSLLARHREENGPIKPEVAAIAEPLAIPNNPTASVQLTELYDEGTQEIFGKYTQATATASDDSTLPADTEASGSSFELNPLAIARAKLPMALRNRKFGRPSFHAHSQAQPHKPQTAQV